jgi:hypothetical protein
MLPCFAVTILKPSSFSPLQLCSYLRAFMVSPYWIDDSFLLHLLFSVSQFGAPHLFPSIFLDFKPLPSSAPHAGLFEARGMDANGYPFPLALAILADVEDGPSVRYFLQRLVDPQGSPPAYHEWVTRTDMLVISDYSPAMVDAVAECLPNATHW